MADIFLSYAREDLRTAQMLATALEKQGWSVWWDRSKILPGQNVDQVIKQAIADARCLIVIWSPAGNNSPWVTGEANTGLRRNILVQVHIGEFDPPINFQGFHSEDFSAWMGSKEKPEFQKLNSAVRALIGSAGAQHLKNPGDATKNAELANQVPETKPLKSKGLKWWVLSSVVVVIAGGLFAVNAPEKLQIQSRSAVSSQPEMVTIPDGEFWMGSADNDESAWDYEKPRHKVQVAKFALGKYEVTKQQFAEFVRATGYKASGCWIWSDTGMELDTTKDWQSPGFAQAESEPVVCVSYQDAQAYIAWLNRQTGGVFRLPTEAEWEYAARAKSATRFFWGDAEQDAPQHAWFIDNSKFKTQTVGGANHDNNFGLYDMAGNVWEWTQDCWHDNYQNAPRDGKAWEVANGGDCGERVIRGGSWINGGPDNLRSADRLRTLADYSNSEVGFRLAQDLP